MSNINTFIAELSADARAAPYATRIADGLAALDLEGDGNSDAAALFGCVQVICRLPLPLLERLRALVDLASIEGGVGVPRALLVDQPNNGV
jgi:hypothetical protein